jgi:tetratricopeptide (TPR) repeat protein
MVSSRFTVLPLVLLLSSLLAAQARPGGGGAGAGTGGGSKGTSGGGNVVTPTRPNNFPNPGVSPLETRGPTFLNGKVVVDDGTPLTDPALIQSVCQGSLRNEGYTDSKGHFSIDLNSQREAFGSAQESYSGNPAMSGRPGMRRNIRDCDLQAVLPGFTSKTVELASKMTDVGSADVGTIVLHRMERVEGFTISATSAQAPDKAKKDYQKGREDVAKGKLDAAKEKFSHAVELYPRYAVAWFELGRVQLQQNDPTAAKNSFQHAIDADNKFISPYEQLADVALKEKQWKDLDTATEQLVKLNPLSFPQYWYYNAIANYFMQNFDKAEKSAQQGMNIDAQHRIPKIEYVLGLILVQKKDFQGALTHLRNYVRLSPNANDLDVAHKQIAALEKMTQPMTSQNK